ncbi:MAG TPA: acyl-CoA dehydrogenase family protein [Rhizomicrobium sp.]|nr:acyl-CoA dehydrogenase family protein [Rhizomicrobium sp.]
MNGPFVTPNSEDAFLGSARAFLAEALTPELRAAGRATTGVHSEIGAAREWHRRLAAKGWIAPAWPREHGGTGWSARQRFLFERECADHDAPILSASGVRALGPLLIAIGTQAQKRRYLPAILSGADLWCQGFSEAGAGSDLAALSLHAERDGPSYRLTGRKLWTTGAQHSNRMFALVRTKRSEKPHHGITFLLLDMDSPGLSVTPIRTIDGECEFNEVVFEDVRVPVENRVGAEGEGWAAAKLLMRFARSNNTTAAHLRRSLRRAREGAATALHDPRLAEIEIALETYESLELALLTAGRLDGSDETASSMLKTLATELNQRISEFGLVQAGAVAGGGIAPKRYFATRAASIYSGTNEIHRNLLARHLLG